MRRCCLFVALVPMMSPYNYQSNPPSFLLPEGKVVETRPVFFFPIFHRHPGYIQGLHTFPFLHGKAPLQGRRSSLVPSPLFGEGYL